MPISGGKLRVRSAGAGVELLVFGEAVVVGRDGDETVIDLPTLELFEVVRIPLA